MSATPLLRCDAFELLESDVSLSLCERSLEAGAVQLLAGLLRHNTTLRELDLSAADVDKVGAGALASALESNAALLALRLAHNPLIDEEAREALRRVAAARRKPSLTLVL